MWPCVWLSLIEIKFMKTTDQMNGNSRFPSGWQVPTNSVTFDDGEMKARLRDLTAPCFIVNDGKRWGVSHEGVITTEILPGYMNARGSAPPLRVDQLGNSGFRETYRTDYAYYAGSMANGIASESGLRAHP